MPLLCVHSAMTPCVFVLLNLLLLIDSMYILYSVWIIPQMISVERLLAYGDLQPEAPLETPTGREKPPSLWPSSGSIKLDKMNLRYSSDTPYVLKDITAHVQPAEKVYVCTLIIYYILL